jgi:peptidoglycan hydrolase-like protein with peptidoglycan-binding domain
VADLRYEPFRQNRRIQAAAENAPPMKLGEGDREAVVVLQQALIKAGFSIPDGATGHYGNETVQAVRAVERKHSLLTDSGIAGRQVIGKLDELLHPGGGGIVVTPRDLRILLQQAPTNGGFVHPMYFRKTVPLLAAYHIGLAPSDHRQPELPYSAGTVDPSSSADLASVRDAAEKQMPGMANFLRIIFCRFPDGGMTGDKYYAATNGGAFPLEGGKLVPDFILINVSRFRPDGSTLLHEMIHAAGLTHHDPDPDSIFAGGESRTGTTLKPEHAKRLTEAFFAR